MAASKPTASQEAQGMSREDRGFPVKSQMSRQGSSGTKTAVKGAAGQIWAKALSNRKTSKAEQKDDRRRQKAIEREMAMAERAAKRQGLAAPPGEKLSLSALLKCSRWNLAMRQGIYNLSVIKPGYQMAPESKPLNL